MTIPTKRGQSIVLFVISMATHRTRDLEERWLEKDALEDVVDG